MLVEDNLSESTCKVRPEHIHARYLCSLEVKSGTNNILLKCYLFNYS